MAMNETIYKTFGATQNDRYLGSRKRNASSVSPEVNEGCFVAQKSKLVAIAPSVGAVQLVQATKRPSDQAIGGLQSHRASRSVVVAIFLTLKVVPFRTKNFPVATRPRVYCDKQVHLDTDRLQRELCQRQLNANVNTMGTHGECQ